MSHDLDQLADAVQDYHKKVWVALLELKHKNLTLNSDEKIKIQLTSIVEKAHVHLNQAFDAACKLKIDAEHWRNLLREVLVGDTTMEERIELARDLGVERKGDMERVNENVNALDGYVGEVLKEKEGGIE